MNKKKQKIKKSALTTLVLIGVISIILISYVLSKKDTNVTSNNQSNIVDQSGSNSDEKSSKTENKSDQVKEEGDEPEDDSVIIGDEFEIILDENQAAGEF